ncbi:MAG: hypothetical protein II954_08685 [Synergistaceae bacterium]|nr:hypothetical protein [Synergistaceae bacterium]
MPNWLLVDRIDGARLILALTRTGTHSDISTCKRYPPQTSRGA